MKLFNAPTLSFTALLALGATAQAQTTLTPVLSEGVEVMPNGSVTSINHVDVNNSGDWLIEYGTDNPDSSLKFGLAFNGVAIHLEGTDLGFPASHLGSWVWASGTIDSIDINDLGDRSLLFNVADVAAVLPNHRVLFWTNGTTGITYPLLEEGVTLVDSMIVPAGFSLEEPVGAVWDSISEVWQNNSNELIVGGRTNTDSDDMLVKIVHDGAGNILSQTMFAVDGVDHAAVFGASGDHGGSTVQGFTMNQENIDFNDSGQTIFMVDDNAGTGTSTSDNDSHYYLDTTEIIWEADPSPQLNGFPYGHLTSAEVSINNAGDWIVVVEDDGPTSDDFMLIKNGAIVRKEGDPVPAIAGGWVITGSGWGQPVIHDNDSITWLCDWADATGFDGGLFRDDTILIQEGVTIVNGSLVEDIEASSRYMSASENGSWILKRIQTTGDVDVAVLIEVDLTNTSITCDPANDHFLGNYCKLDTSAFGSGVGSDLHIEATDGPAGEFGFLLVSSSATNSTAVFNGVLCLDNPTGRYNLQVATNQGLPQLNSLGQFDGAGVLQNISGTSVSGSGFDVPLELPFSPAVMPIMPGDTWSFQLWYRDQIAMPGDSANFSNVLTAQF